MGSGVWIDSAPAGWDPGVGPTSLARSAGIQGSLRIVIGCFPPTRLHRRTQMVQSMQWIGPFCAHSDLGPQASTVKPTRGHELDSTMMAVWVGGTSET